MAGLGSLASTYFTLPTDEFPTGAPIQVYGYKYPIQNCTSGTCFPAYLWYNGYIPANRINSVDANGKPNGYEGIPANYKPAVAPLIPYGRRRCRRMRRRAPTYRRSGAPTRCGCR